MSRMWFPDWQGLASRSSFRGLSVLLLVLVVTLSGYFIRLKAPTQAYAESVALERRLLQTLEERQLQVGELDAERSALEDAEQRLRTERWRLDAGEGMSELLDELAMSRHEHGLLFERLDVLEAQKQPEYSLTPLEMRVRGHYPALRAWLEQWLQRLRLLSVSRLALAMDDDAGLLAAQLQINAYQTEEPLPVPKALADEPARIALAPGSFDPFRAWSSRVAENGLARIPLEQLEMVGSLSRDGRHQALLRSGRRVYRVEVGARLGRDDGVVVAIDTAQVTVRERIYISGGWQARHRYLALGKSAPREVRDEAEELVERDGADAGGHPDGSGGGSSG